MSRSLCFAREIVYWSFDESEMSRERYFVAWVSQIRSGLGFFVKMIF